MWDPKDNKILEFQNECIEIHCTLSNFLGFLCKFQIGNAWIDDATNTLGLVDYLWTHALNSDETHEGVITHCDFVNEDNSTKQCDNFIVKALEEMGEIDFYHIYAPLCINPTLKNSSTVGSVSDLFLHLKPL